MFTSSSQTKETQLQDDTLKNSGNNKKYMSKRIKCEKCDKKFNKESTFKKHIESIHKETLNTLNKETLITLNKVTFLEKRRSHRNTKGRAPL